MRSSQKKSREEKIDLTKGFMKNVEDLKWKGEINEKVEP